MIAKSPSQNSWQCGPQEEGQPQRTSANLFPCFLRIPHAATASKVWPCSLLKLTRVRHLVVLEVVQLCWRAYSRVARNRPPLPTRAGFESDAVLILKPEQLARPSLALGVDTGPYQLLIWQICSGRKRASSTPWFP